jgi:hypothetical protein
MAFIQGLVQLVKAIIMTTKGLIWLGRHLWRWVTGRHFNGKRPGGWTWRDGAPAPSPTTWRHPHWSYWPGWQRSLTRNLLAAVVVATSIWPLQTIIGIGCVMAGVTSAVIMVRRANRPDAVEQPHWQQQITYGPDDVIDAEVVP